MCRSWSGGPCTPAPHSAPSAAHARLNSAFPRPAAMEVGVGGQVPTGGGWVFAAPLAEGGVDLDTFLAQDEAGAARLRSARPPGRRRELRAAPVGVARLPADHRPAVPLRRVPRRPVGQVAYDRSALGRLLARMAVPPAGFACLPGDPAAALPGGRVVDGEEALLPGATKPYAGSAAFRELVDPDGEPLPTRDRASCRMFYTVRPEDTCATCPRTRDADRAGKPSAAAGS